jgi:hypothetical protein
VAPTYLNSIFNICSPVVITLYDMHFAISKNTPILGDIELVEKCLYLSNTYRYNCCQLVISMPVLSDYPTEH